MKTLIAFLITASVASAQYYQPKAYQQAYQQTVYQQPVYSAPLARIHIPRQPAVQQQPSCLNGQCNVQRYQSPVQRLQSPVSNSVSSVCQMAAQAMARMGNMRHLGHNRQFSLYEGIGVGPTPESALGACCYSGNKGTTGAARPEVGRGVAQGSNGLWYAVRMYR